MESTRKRRAAGATAAPWLVLLATALVIAVAFTMAASAPARAGKSLAGSLLVAAPDMIDPNFAGTVVFMLQHDPGGALGIVVNRPMGEVPLARLMALLQETEAEAPDDAEPGVELPVFYGGPVEPYRAFTLHSRDRMFENSVPVDEDTAFNVRADVLQALADGTAPERMLVALGYSGWGPGQLESELERGGWLVVAADAALIFAEEPERSWDRAVALFTPEL